MKQRFRARELWLFAPFLLIIAAAFYWQRVESASGPNGRGMFVSNVKVEAAPGYYQEKGLSHRVTVTVSYGGQKPTWWGKTYKNIWDIDALQPDKPTSLASNLKPEQVVSMGEAITVVRAGKMMPLAREYGGNFVEAKFDGTNYVSVNYFNLNGVPRAWGAITLHGLYRIGKQPQLVLTRQIRPAGTTSIVPLDKNPGARVTKLKASPFRAVMETNNTGARVLQDQTQIELEIARTRASPLTQNAQSIITDSELVDEKGKVYRDYSTPGLSLIVSDIYGGGSSEKSSVFQGQNLKMGLEKSLRTTGQLKLRGKISVDKGWPIPFEVKLPPRSDTWKSSADSPDWKRPTKLAPMR